MATFSSEWFVEQALAGNMYHACSTGAVTLSTVSATCTGLVVSNNYGSNKALVMYSASFAPSTAVAGASVVGLAISAAQYTTAVVHTTPAVIHNAIAVGSNLKLGAARADAAATLPAAPVWLRPLASVVAASSITPTKYGEYLGGTIIVPPGGNISFSYLTTAAVGIAAFSWVEIDKNLVDLP